MIATATGYSPQLIERLLAVASRRPSEPLEVAEFDWSVPRRFTREQTQRLEKFAAALAKQVRAALLETLGEELSLVAFETRECYGHKLGTPEDAVRLGLQTPAGEPCGCIELPSSLARQWVAKLLGDESGVERESFSKLESDLLRDLLSNCAAAVAGASEEVGGSAAIEPGSSETVEPGDEEWVVFELGLEEAESPDLRYCLLAASLEGVAGAATTESVEPAEVAARLREHIAQAPTKVTARLGQAKLALGEILALEPGDVIVLDSGGEMDLCVQGKSLMRARPARSEGKYAAQIVVADDA
jgi:flagellar motor switch protein FliM